MAEFLRIAWPYSPWGSQSQLRSKFQKLLDIGINAICCYRHIDDYKNESYATVRYDTRYNIAAEMGIKIIQYTGVHRLHYTGKKTGERFIERYIKFPACAGFLYGDEPALMGWDHAGCKWAVDEAHRQGAGLPDHPMFPVWNYGIRSEQYNFTCRPNWCELYDVGCVDCYPTALRGDGWKSFLEYWINWYYHTDKGDGFGDCGKGMIPVIQAHVESRGKHPNMMPDLVGQYNVWKAKYGNNLKGIAFWLPHVEGASVGFLESGSVAENLRNQIKEVAYLTGWTPTVPETFTIQETTCPQDKSVFWVKVSSVAENNKSLACPVDGTALPLRGVEITEIVAIPLIDTLKEEIAALDKRIADLQGEIEALKAQKAEAIEIIGV